jgi:hypothetical protein
MRENVTLRDFLARGREARRMASENEARAALIGAGLPENATMQQIRGLVDRGDVRGALGRVTSLVEQELRKIDEEEGATQAGPVAAAPQELTLAGLLGRGGRNITRASSARAQRIEEAGRALIGMLPTNLLDAGPSGTVTPPGGAPVPTVRTGELTAPLSPAIAASAAAGTPTFTNIGTGGEVRRIVPGEAPAAPAVVTPIAPSTAATVMGPPEPPASEVSGDPFARSPIIEAGVPPTSADPIASAVERGLAAAGDFIRRELSSGMARAGERARVAATTGVPPAVTVPIPAYPTMTAEQIAAEQARVAGRPATPTMAPTTAVAATDPVLDQPLDAQTVVQVRQIRRQARIAGQDPAAAVATFLRQRFAPAG